MQQRHMASWPTATGSIAAYSDKSFNAVDKKPVVLFLHGALRNAEFLVHWIDLIGDAADVILLDLPGHGRSSSPAVGSVASMASDIDGAIRVHLGGRRILLVGESIGGTIALKIGGASGGGPVKAVFAADPPMTTAKLWSVSAVFKMTMARQPENSFLPRLARDSFGLSAEGSDELIYYPYIGQLQVPGVIATGDVPLLPPRRMTTASSVFDDVDAFVTQNLYPGKVRIERIQDCGHLLLIEARQRCLAIMQRQISESV